MQILIKKNIFIIGTDKLVSSNAEVDYVIQNGSEIIPIEAKGGSGTTLKSMYIFLESHPKSQYGIRFSAQNYSMHNNIRSIPLYAIYKLDNF